jgi:hypothetical protein
VAAGDSGAPSCDQSGDSIGWPYSAQFGLSVSGLASTPYNVAVGGTDFSWCLPIINGATGQSSGCPTSSADPGPYWNTSNNTTTEPYESARGYVAEVPWNDSCLNPIIASYINTLAAYLGMGSSGIVNEETACNIVQANWPTLYRTYGIMLAPYIDSVGSSGGASNCVVNSTNPNSTSFPSGACTTGATSTGAGSDSIPLYNDGWIKPSWQAGVTGIPLDGVRDIPDVSFFAADGRLNSAYLVCVSADGPCIYPTNGEETYEEFGGTSFGSPEMAGVMALINQKAAAPQGLPLRQFYTLAGQQKYLNCSTENVSNSNPSCYFHGIDQGTNSMPCDNGASIGGAYYNNRWYIYPATLEYAGTVSPNCTAINPGDTVGTLTSASAVTTTNPEGIAYRAVTGYSPATGLGTPNVANIVNAWTQQVGTKSSTMTVQLSASTITANTALTISVAVTGGSGTPTGTITVTGGGYGATQSLTAGSASITIPASSLAPGSITLTVYYSGDGTYTSQNQTESVTVTGVTPAVSVSAPASDNSANVVFVSVTVSGPAGAPTPTGTVILSAGTYSSAAAALSSAGIASFGIPAGALPAGSDIITASYSGSASLYSAASGTATINIVNTATAASTLTITPNLASGVTSIASSQSLSITASVTGASGVPTGSVIVYALFGTGVEFRSVPTTLTGGSATVVIPANTLTLGSITLEASYSGDATYSQIGLSNIVTITVTLSGYSLAATTPASVSPGSAASSTITGNPSSTAYTGTVTLSSCSLTKGPANATAVPSCAVSGAITYTSGTATGSGTATVSTYDTTAYNLARPKLPSGRGWPGTGLGAVFALLVLFGIPARRRSWRNMLSIIVVLVVLGTVVSCGGGGSGGGGGGGTTYITTAGPYTFTVTGTGNDSAKTQETTTFTVTVN